MISSPTLHLTIMGNCSIIKSQTLKLPWTKTSCFSIAQLSVNLFLVTSCSSAPPKFMSPSSWLLVVLTTTPHHFLLFPVQSRLGLLMESAIWMWPPTHCYIKSFLSLLLIPSHSPHSPSTFLDSLGWIWFLSLPNSHSLYLFFPRGFYHFVTQIIVMCLLALFLLEVF